MRESDSGLSVMMLVTNAPILTQIRALCGRKLLRRAPHLSIWEHQATPGYTGNIHHYKHRPPCVRLLFRLLGLHTKLSRQGAFKTLHLSSWENRRQNIRVRGSKQTQSIDNEEKQEKVQAVTEWSHRDIVRWISSWPQRMQRFSVLTALASEPPGKGREDPGPSIHLLKEWNISER